MGGSIQIEVVDRLTGERRVEDCRLPLEIGKKPEAANHIQLDPKYRTVSRVHGRLEQRDNGLVYVDCSSNGTTIAGRLLKGEERALKGGETLKIENYDLYILDSAPLLVKHTAPTMVPRGEFALPPGKLMHLSVDADGVHLAEAETEGEGQVAAILSFDGSHVILDIQDADLVEAVTLNNGPVTGMHVEARPFDVIGVRGDRLELLKPDHDKIVCGNPDCHLLNDLPYEENCTWCGYYLAASGSFTRVTPP